MASNPACPPIPNLTDLNNPNKYMLINPIDVVLDEFLVMRHGENISCIKIVHVYTDYATRITSQFTYENDQGNAIGMRIDQLNNNGYQLYRKSPSKDFDDVVNETNKLVRSYPPDKKLSSMESILATPGIPERVGEYLGGPSSLENPYKKSGGRRKRRLTRRTRKNKRKSTRRVRRKYKK